MTRAMVRLDCLEVFCFSFLELSGRKMTNQNLSHCETLFWTNWYKLLMLKGTAAVNWTLKGFFSFSSLIAVGESLWFLFFILWILWGHSIFSHRLLVLTVFSLVSVDNICLHLLRIQLEPTAAVKTVHHDVRPAMDKLTISVPAVCTA